MVLFVKYDFNLLAKKTVKERLEKLSIRYTLNGLGELEIKDPLSPEQKDVLARTFLDYGIEILDDQKTALVQRVKFAISEMLENESAQAQKLSAYLAEKLNYSYAHLSNVFSEATHTSIENFVILRKVDLVKELLIKSDLTLTEIAFKLHYSSVAHLSGQFKKTTGLTPTTFQKIIKRRKENNRTNKY